MIPNNTTRFRRGEKHHWWPKSLSQFWKNDDGHVNRIEISGSTVTSNPKEFAHIKNGHNFIVSGGSSWESTIEHEFDSADRNMAKVVDDLQTFREWNYFEKRFNFAVQEKDGENLNLLRMCIMSLVVRSPQYRSKLDSIVTSIRGDIPKNESKNLISANMGQSYRDLVKSSENRGKFAVLFSDDVEFVYGDGVYNTVPSSPQGLSTFEIIIPMTPNIAVIWISPVSYSTRPRVIAVNVEENDVVAINQAIQIYSKEYLFYRNQPPQVFDHFKSGEYMQYSKSDNPMTNLIYRLFPDQDKLSSFAWFD